MPILVLAVAPRTISATKVAASVPRNSTRMATNTLGIYAIIVFRIPLTAVSPSAFVAGTRNTRKMNQNTIFPKIPAASKRTPMFCSSRERPMRFARLSKPILRSRKVTALLSAAAIMYPTSRMSRKPSNKGTNTSTISSAWPKALITASPKLLKTVITLLL